jgi:hypothetical protein
VVKIRVLYNSGPVWENYFPEQIKEVTFTPFSYFNVFLKNGESFSADKIDTTEQ